MAKCTRRQAPPLRLILDAGAVIALRAPTCGPGPHSSSPSRSVPPSRVPAVVVAETVRGSGADAPVNRVIEAVGEVRAADERVGRTASRLLGDAGSELTINALVVANTIEADGTVIRTGDPTPSARWHAIVP